MIESSVSPSESSVQPTVQGSCTQLSGYKSKRFDWLENGGP